MSTRRANLLNLGLLQLGCAVPLLACALDRRGAGVVLAWSVLVLAVSISEHRGRDLRLLLAGAILGTLGELAAVLVGLMSFVHPSSPLPFPGWLPPSWALLGIATAHVLRPLRGRMLGSVIVGGLVGMLGLYGAMAAEEIVVTHGWHVVVISGWLGVLVALLIFVAPWLELAPRSRGRFPIHVPRR
ncbi:DUF2878 family protein [Paraliomyxa miuraensis]|uniref:DUF2878 family protein n=1 Tax=Paraliomyxa miuraensis TaxID=376150 RepID=UPI00225A438F|nr:DUF2878 family protein [Paraliomyxa miuraensis]MCX4241421.1 DUF2878 family protein [Paraliomyxa miuraensis]